MAIRRCEHCEELMQEGYSVESAEVGYLVYCSSSCASEELTFEQAGNAEVEYHDWTQSEMDDEDFEILMNILISDPSPPEIANVFDILHREDGSLYGPMGVLAAFITYLNTQEEN